MFLLLYEKLPKRNKMIKRVLTFLFGAFMIFGGVNSKSKTHQILRQIIIHRQIQPLFQTITAFFNTLNRNIQ